MRHDESNFQEVLGDIVQLERVDILMPGDAATAALNAEVYQDRDVQLGASFPDWISGFVFNGTDPAMAPAACMLFKTILIYGAAEFVVRAFAEEVMMGETDEFVRVPLDDAGQILVAAAGDEAHRAHAVILDLGRPAIGLFFIGEGMFRSGGSKPQVARH